MIARSGDGGSGSLLHPHGAHTPGTSGEEHEGRSQAGAPPQLKSVAKQAVTDLENYVVALQAHWGAIVRRFFFKIALWGFAFLAALVFLFGGLIFLLVGLADTLSALFGQAEGLGKLIVGVALIAPVGAYLAFKSRKRDGHKAEEANEARSELQQTAKELAKRAATPAGLCAAAVVGAGATKLVSSRALRRLTLFALRTARSIGIASLFAERSKADSEADTPEKRAGRARNPI